MVTRSEAKASTWLEEMQMLMRLQLEELPEMVKHLDVETATQQETLPEMVKCSAVVAVVQPEPAVGSWQLPLPAPAPSAAPS